MAKPSLLRWTNWALSYLKTLKTASGKPCINFNNFENIISIMREPTIVTTNRKTTIPKDNIRKSAELAYGKLFSKKREEISKGKKRKKAA